MTDRKTRAAEEWAGRLIEDDEFEDQAYCSDLMLAYLTGWKACREEAELEFKKNMEKRPETEEDYGYNHGHQECIRIVRTLGDEEADLG